MFIVNTSCISPQASYNFRLFTLGQVEHLLGNQYKALEPSYKKLIPLNLLRRMDKSVRMGVGAGMTLLKQAEQEGQEVEGIIIGSANGSIDKSISFLHQMIDYDEGTLTPSDFVQSTSNSISGTLALLGNVKGYNNTHVNNGLAFESALLDAFLQFETTPVECLILGGVDELSQSNFNVDELRGLYKRPENTHSENLLHSNTIGTVAGEGAALFTLEREYSTNAKAKIVDVDQFVFPTFEEVTERTEAFLARNGMAYHDIDVLFMGYNGDVRTDTYYEHLRTSLFPNTGVYTYKNLVGEYYTASSFALWMAANLLGGQTMPRRSIWTPVPRRAKRILIYNHYEGSQHGLILVKRPW